MNIQEAKSEFPITLAEAARAERAKADQGSKPCPTCGRVISGNKLACFPCLKQYVENYIKEQNEKEPVSDGNQAS